MKKRKICFLPLVSSLVIGLGVGILTGEYLAYLVIGLGVGGLLLGLTQRDALLKK
ncbi:hypothetical protein GOV08_03675 [Candidatus Woesearchaeota archaeon]|nr:hypothetical protein [Candidatus Woesearchaeota archaeon]